MKARHALLSFTLFAAASAQAADWGLGAAFNDGTTVLVPIKTPYWLIEPEARTSHSSTAASGGQSLESNSFGSGFYIRTDLGPMFESYVGGRLIYDWGKQQQGTTDQKSSGWQIVPTIGVQHFFSKQFSVGVDFGLRYSTSEVKQTSPSSTSTEHGWDSVTRIVLRAFFG